MLQSTYGISIAVTCTFSKDLMPLQAIEAKESLPIRAESTHRCSITYQSLFPMYEQLAGMSVSQATS